LDPRVLLSKFAAIAVSGFSSPSSSRCSAAWRPKRIRPPARPEPDVSAAVRYFGERKLLPQLDTLAEIRFRTVSTKDNYDLFFISFAEEKPVPGLTH